MLMCLGHGQTETKKTSTIKLRMIRLLTIPFAQKSKQDLRSTLVQKEQIIGY